MKKFKNKIIISAFILTAAGLVTRLLGFAHRIFMTNIIGAEGMGLYQLIFPVYSLAWAITCAGFTTAVSKLASSAKAKKDYEAMRAFMVFSAVITGLIASFISVLLFFSANFIATYIFREPRIELGFKVLSFAIPFMAMGSSIRGFFLGIQEAKIPAISQIIEQVMRMFLIYVLSMLYFDTLERAVGIAVLGIVAGEIVSFLYVVFAYKDRKIKIKMLNKVSKEAKIIKTLLAMSIPLGLSRIISSLLSTAENILIPQKLAIYGVENPLEEFGKLTGMAMPLVQFPSAILMALAISLVQAISEASELKNYSQINDAIKKTILFSMVIGIGAAFGFILFGGEIGQIIYSYDIDHILSTIGFIVPFVYANMLLLGILNGLGLQAFIFKNSIFYSVLSIMCVLFLIPRFGILGYITGIGVASIIVFILNITQIKEITKIKIDILNWFIKPLIAAFIALGILGFFQNWIISAVVFSLVYLGICYILLKNQLKNE